VVNFNVCRAFTEIRQVLRRIIYSQTRVWGFSSANNIVLLYRANNVHNFMLFIIITRVNRRRRRRRLCDICGSRRHGQTIRFIAGYISRLRQRGRSIGRSV